MILSDLDYKGLRPTRAVIDLDAIADNMRTLLAMTPARTQVMAVVKADGYGHGAPWVARTALEAGASSLGIATVSEGQILRRSGVTAPIVLLGSILPEEAETACHDTLQVTVADESLLEAVQRAARKATGTPVSVHLKIDTGLRRFGTMPDCAPALATRIASDPNLRLAGVFTHLASADEPDDPFTFEQLALFDRTVKAIVAAGVSPPPLHAANSAGILRGLGTSYTIVRAGIALYGVPPSADVPLPQTMRPAMRIESRVTRVIPLAPGDSTGYNRTFRAHEAMVGALVPIGYADGYRRELSSRGWVGLSGQRAHVLGRVSMDQIVVEVPRGIGLKVGDPVHILGGNIADGAPSILEMAEQMRTNPYEVLVCFSRRVPRIYLRNGEVVAVSAQADSAAMNAWAEAPEIQP